MKREQESLSATAYRERAKAYQKQMVSSWIIFLRTGAFVMAAVCVLIGVGLAWFANNKEVQADGMLVEVAVEEDFKLAVKGTDLNVGVWDSMLTEANIGDPVQGTEFLATTPSNPAIRFAITEQSHMGNRDPAVSASGNQQAALAGIDPGSSGKLIFYVIPRMDGPLTLNLKVYLTAVAQEEEELPLDAVEILMGHVLLFAGYDEGSNSYQGWISSDAQPWEMTLTYPENTVSTENSTNQETTLATLTRREDGSLCWKHDTAKKDTAYPVTLYWIWPEILGEYLYKDSTAVENKPVLFPKDTNEANEFSPAVLPDQLFAKMCAAQENKMSNAYFKWAVSITEQAQGRENFQRIATEASLSSMRQNPTQLLTYGELCQYYNLADQYLGENIRFVSLTVEAESKKQ